MLFILVLCVRLVCNHLDGEERAVCFALTVFLMSYDSQSSVAISHGTVDRSAVWDCGISRSYSLAYLAVTLTNMSPTSRIGVYSLL